MIITHDMARGIECLLFYNPPLSTKDTFVYFMIRNLLTHRIRHIILLKFMILIYPVPVLMMPVLKINCWVLNNWKWKLTSTWSIEKFWKWSNLIFLTIIRRNFHRMIHRNIQDNNIEHNSPRKVVNSFWIFLNLKKFGIEIFSRLWAPFVILISLNRGKKDNEVRYFPISNRNSATYIKIEFLHGEMHSKYHTRV